MIDLGIVGSTVLSVVDLVDGHVLNLDGDVSLTIEAGHEVTAGVRPGLVVASASADEVTGRLELAFVSGPSLVVPPDPVYEAWHLMRPDGFTGSMPGGGLM